VENDALQCRADDGSECSFQNLTDFFHAFRGAFGHGGRRPVVRVQPVEQEGGLDGPQPIDLNGDPEPLLFVPEDHLPGVVVAFLDEQVVKLVGDVRSERGDGTQVGHRPQLVSVGKVPHLPAADEPELVFAGFADPVVEFIKRVAVVFHADDIGAPAEFDGHVDGKRRRGMAPKEQGDVVGVAQGGHAAVVLQAELPASFP